MIQGINTAAAGMASVIDQNDIIANNLANVNTVGFKQLMPTFMNIKNLNVQVENENDDIHPGLRSIGNISAGTMIAETHIDLSQGALNQTERKLDVAVNGEGFFAVSNENGEFYTRNGNFALNEEGELVTKSGEKVLSEGGGSIKLEIEARSLSDLVISNDGRVIQGGVEIDKLKIVDFEDKSKLRVVGNSLITNTDKNQQPVELDNPSVSQGYLESSNANVVKSMIDSITGSRTYETLSKVIRDSDGTLRKTVNEVGAVVR